MKLNYGKTFLLGFGFLGVSVLWLLYNSYVPIFLQAGNPEFQVSKATTVGFGLSAGLAGFIMTLDNIAALFIQPIMGVISDRTRTRLGRRMPYILAGAPIAAVAFILIPIAVNRIPAALSGQTGLLGGQLAFFMVVVGLMLLAMAAFRTPLIALMPDITPSPLRSKANGVINMMGGIGGILALFGGAFLYEVNKVLPFVVGAIILVLTALVVVWKIKESKEYTEESRTSERWWDTLKGIGAIPNEDRKSLVLILAAIFCWFVGYNSLETFFTSYGTFRLGVTESRASLMMGFFSVTFLAFSIPGGMLAERWGRRRTIITGLSVLTVLLVGAFFLPNATAITAILFLGGMSWALVNINSLPMIVDLAPSDRLCGTYTGLYYISGTLAAIVGPILNGAIIDATGKNYNMIFIVAPAFMVLAIAFMWFVTRGEAKTS
ncbi:MAG TPA: SLC45 family MFS transporter [Anaerolineae bacterium]|nr:SLC45 family MFS transporter [Anaerolineae bacterium]